MKYKLPCVYILASSRRGTLYTGVTSDIVKRVYEHKNNLMQGFAANYKIKNLVWFEFHENMESAILKEKKVKKWPREYKYNLVEENNPDWIDLYNSLDQ